MGNRPEKLMRQGRRRGPFRILRNDEFCYLYRVLSEVYETAMDLCLP
jgi:hypothetical protein